MTHYDDIRVGKCPTCGYAVSLWAPICPNCYTTRPGGGGKPIGPLVRITKEESKARYLVKGIDPKELLSDSGESGYETRERTEDEFVSVWPAQDSAIKEHRAPPNRRFKQVLLMMLAVPIFLTLAGWLPWPLAALSSFSFALGAHLTFRYQEVAVEVKIIPVDHEAE